MTLTNLHEQWTEDTVPIKCWCIVLFKMFSCWIWGIFNVQIQSERGAQIHMMCHINVKDLHVLGICK